MAQDFSDSPFPDAYSSSERSLEATLGDVVRKLNKDMRVVGVCLIIYGGLSCVTIIGAIVGVPYIIMGLRLRSAADAFETFRTQNGDREALRHALEKQRSYFFIHKVFIIITLAFFVLYIGLIALAVGAGFFSSAGYY